MVDAKTAIAASYAELYGEARIKIAKLEAERQRLWKLVDKKRRENQKLQDALEDMRGGTYTKEAMLMIIEQALEVSDYQS